jgi:hypothetical protein
VNDPLYALAARVADDSSFLSSALTANQDRHRLDDAALAATLGCIVAVLTRLRLCRRPGTAEPDWTADEGVAMIAGRFGIDATALRRILKEADGVRAGTGRVVK